MSVVSMRNIPVRFVVSKLSDADVEALKEDRAIISKMILSPEDFELFHYREGDAIEVESRHGDRLWCIIFNLEVVTDKDRVILIFTLIRNPKDS